MPDVQHASLTDPNLHEPKGISSASEREIYTADGSGSGAWTDPTDAVFPLTKQRRIEISFPAQAINPPGAVSDADVDTDNGTFLFDAATDETIVITVRVPTNFQDNGSFINPHIHWAKTTSAAGDVVWAVEYKVYKRNAVGSLSWIAHDSNNTVGSGTTDTNEAEKSLVTVFDSFDTTGAGVAPDDYYLVRIYRDADNAADTYGADARLLSFDFFYDVEDIGDEVP